MQKEIATKRRKGNNYVYQISKKQKRGGFYTLGSARAGFFDEVIFSKLYAR